MTYEQIGFRALYHNFCTFALNDALKAAIREYPDAEKANCVLVFGYVDPHAGLTLEVLGAARETDGDYTFFDPNNEVRAFVRIGDVMKQEFVFFQDDDDELARRYSRKIEALRVYNASADVERSRGMVFMDSVRDKEFPDDVQVMLLRDSCTPEDCWVRITGLGKDFFKGILLTEPQQDFGCLAGDPISFYAEEDRTGTIICFADRNSSVRLLKKDLADGSMLKNAIKTYLADKTQDHYIDVMELLRDCPVWVPAGDTPVKVDGEACFPVYTSFMEMKRYDAAVTKRQMPFVEAISLAGKSRKSIKGIVVDPDSTPYVLGRDAWDMVEKLPSRAVD